MSLIERYRTLYAHEIDADAKLLAMIASVPAERRDDPGFQRAVNLAAHLAACRQNWLGFLTDDGAALSAWFEEAADFACLTERFARVHAAWSAYLASLDDDALVQDFEFTEMGQRFRWNVEGQVLQLAGHGHYHRGQIALLVDQLGGETVDTDYVDWAIASAPPGRYGAVTG